MTIAEFNFDTLDLRIVDFGDDRWCWKIESGKPYLCFESGYDEEMRWYLPPILARIVNEAYERGTGEAQQAMRRSLGID